MDVLTKEQRSKNMQAIRNKDSKIELLLAKSLWRQGFRYRKNNKSVFGKPDLTFKRYKVAIFVDSEYFHGKDWANEKHRIKSNTEFWHKKIEKNMLRDQQVNTELLKNNWKVLRFWGKEIEKNIDFCIGEIIKVIEERKHDQLH